MLKELVKGICGTTIYQHRRMISIALGMTIVLSIGAALGAGEDHHPLFADGNVYFHNYDDNIKCGPYYPTPCIPVPPGG